MERIVEAATEIAPIDRPETIIQISDLSGHTLSIQKISKSTFTIGRAWGCDVIVNEPHVCPLHASVYSKDGTWQVLDKGSVNGTFIGTKTVTNTQTLRSGECVRMGNRVLSFYNPEHTVTPTKHLYTGLLPFQNWSNISTAICAGVALVAVFILLGYQELVSEVKWKKLLSESSLALVIPFLWAAGWAFIGRISTQQVTFFYHFSTGSLIFVSLLLSDVFVEYLEFMVNGASFAVVWGYVNAGLFFALSIYLSQGVATYLSPFRRAAIASTLSTMMLLLVFVVGFISAPDFEKSPQYSYTLKPIPTKVLPSISLKKHQSNNENLFEKLANFGD